MHELVITLFSLNSIFVLSLKEKKTKTFAYLSPTFIFTICSISRFTLEQFLEHKQKEIINYNHLIDFMLPRWTR